MAQPTEVALEMLYIYPVLVDVVELRIDGLKLPAERVRSAARRRGELQLSDRRTGDRRPRQLMAYLLEPQTMEYVLLPLDNAWVKAINSRGLLIVGVQESRNARRRMEHPQAWWCETVGDTRRPREARVTTPLVPSGEPVT